MAIKFIHPICVKSLCGINIPFARSSEIRCIYMHQLVIIMRDYIWLTGLCKLDPIPHIYLTKKSYISKSNLVHVIVVFLGISRDNADNWAVIPSTSFMSANGT